MFTISCLFFIYIIFCTAGDAWSEIREEFIKRATFRMKEQLIEDDVIANIFSKYLSLKILHFDHLAGSPTQVVSQVMLAAYVDNFDYFYQVHLDFCFISFHIFL